MITLCFLFLTLSILSPWIRRDPKVWGSFLALSLFFGLTIGTMSLLGFIFLVALIALWVFYVQKPTLILFLTLVVVTTCFKLHLIPGFYPIFIATKFKIGLDAAVTGLLPLALLVPLSRSVNDWKLVLKGLFVGCIGIGILALLATFAKATHWDFKLPTFMALRMWANLILTSIPEEAFYRGFVQKTLSSYFHDTKTGKIAALILTSLLFTFAHLYWSPNLAILAFVFLASLLYGAVYLISGKIESAMLCHFLLNLIHMTFFEYHAM